MPGRADIQHPLVSDVGPSKGRSIMKRLILSVVLGFAVFGAGLIAGRDTAIVDDVDLAHAQTCNATFTINIANGCGSPGWAVFAQVTHCPTSVPNTVTANVLDNSNNVIEVIGLAHVGGGVWQGVGNCVNPQAGTRVQFVAMGGTLIIGSGVANDTNCGSC
jgi:hypothetical protein